MKTFLAWSSALVLLSAAATAQVPGMPGMDRVTVEARAEPATARPGERVTVTIEATIEPGWHIYGAVTENGTPTTLRIIDSGPLEPDGIADIPLGHEHEQYGMKQHWIEGTATIRQRFLVPDDAEPGEVTIKGAVDYMACTPEMCDPEASAEFAVKVTIEAGEPRAEYAATTTEETAPPEEGATRGTASTGTTTVAEGDNDLASMPLLLFLLACVGGGLFALAMPCTYPMIPITISFFTKQASNRGGNVAPLALAYGAGIIAIFVLISVIVGPPIAKYAANPWLNLVIGVIFVAFALVLFGLLNLQPPRFLMNLASKASSQGGYFGVFLMGATLVVTSFTCTAPVVGSLLALGGEGGDVGRLVLGMTVFGTTMAVPFVFLSLVPGKLQAMPRSGEWMNTLKVFLGFIEIAAALKFLSNADMSWNLQALSRELFLYLWAGIFVIAGLFLLGMVRLKGESGEIGPGRLVGALGILLMGVYCSYGAAGNRMDWVMTSIIPPYSNRIASAGTGEQQSHAGHTIVVDDYDAARELALAENKLLMLNFTGVT